MSLAEHAEYELRRAGWLDGEDEQSGRAILAAVEAFSRGGWSGGSAPYGRLILNDLLQFRPLGPLTDDPAEWQDVSEFCGRSTWQSRRRPDAFSEDGGKTYRLQSDAKGSPDSRWRWVLWRLHLAEEPGRHVGRRHFERTPLHRSEPAARVSA